MRRFGLFALLMVLVAAGAAAQTLPSGPIRAADGQLLVSGEVTATLGDHDEISYFNYTDYEHNALRLFRVSLSAAWQPVRRFAILGEVRTEDLELPQTYAAYIRFRPWAEREFDIQAGRIPPTFGAFSRQAYTNDNPVIGYPLAYQYLTSIRPNAIPATADDLLRMRARGWLSTFPVGNTGAAPGVPLVTAFRWDTGVQARWATHGVSLTGSVTAGTLSDPRFDDNNGSPQVSMRVSSQPITGLVLGASAARGAWLSSDVAKLLPESSGFTQSAWGADAEYSRDHWLVRSEMVWTQWRVPLAATAPGGVDLDALGAWVEGRYKFTPRLFAGARLDHLGFSDIWNDAGTVALPWDAPISRGEFSLGYMIQRNLTVRAAVQRNVRDAGRVRRRTYFAGQVAYWF